jgi:hypothetical protein
MRAFARAAAQRGGSFVGRAAPLLLSMSAAALVHNAGWEEIEWEMMVDEWEQGEDGEWQGEGDEDGSWGEMGGKDEEEGRAIGEEVKEVEWVGNDKREEEEEGTWVEGGSEGKEAAAEQELLDLAQALVFAAGLMVMEEDEEEGEEEETVVLAGEVVGSLPTYTAKEVASHFVPE